jgi:hypothetical protein
MMPVLISRMAASAGCGVALFDDAPHRAALADDAAVAGRILQHRGEHRQGAAAGRLDQGRQGLHARRRHVAVQHQGHGSGIELRQGLHHRVARAQLRLLQGEGEAATGQRPWHRIAAMAMHDADGGGSEPGGRIQNMLDQRPAGQPVQDLGQVRAHPRALAGGKDRRRSGAGDIAASIAPGAPCRRRSATARAQFSRVRP